MSDDVTGEDTIRETDIVFDCPNCGKSLAIDYRGAGLNIECTDCGEEVTVPIPEGMELSDLDSTPEEQEVRILNLRKLLADSEARGAELASALKEAQARCRELEDRLAKADAAASHIGERVAVVRRAQAEIYRALEEIGEAAAGPGESPEA